MTNIKTISKDELINMFVKIEKRGWIEDEKRITNDGAAGNLLEDLLGIPENNLPIPNAAEWELKTQKDNTSSLLTLFHLEPSPKAVKIVSNLLLPQYGWRHKSAGIKYADDEKSFRATLSSDNWTRGFSVLVNREARRVEIVFDPKKVKEQDQQWLDSVRDRVPNISTLEVTPYWGLDDLFAKSRTKLFNCFFVLVERKKENERIYYHYYKVSKLSGLSQDRFIKAIEKGYLYIDIDARTGHNHGTKFRIKPMMLPVLYEDVEVVLDKPKLASL